MIKKAVTNIKKANEHDARTNLMEELFNDFHRSRHQVYGMNFVRGIFFGVGSVIGGTIVVALVLWLLSLLVDLPGGIGDFVQFVVDIVQNRN